MFRCSLAAPAPILLFVLAAALRCGGDTSAPAEEEDPRADRLYVSVRVGDGGNPETETIAFVVELPEKNGGGAVFAYLSQGLIPQHPLPEEACALDSLFVERDSVFFRLPACMGHGMDCPGWRFASSRQGESIGGGAVSVDDGGADTLRWGGVVCPCDGDCGGPALADSEMVLTHPPGVRRIYRPEYPPEARQAGMEGTVHARVTIDRCGGVVDAEIAHSSAAVFEQPVLASLQLAAFHPARAGTLFVRSRLIIPFEFHLGGAKGEARPGGSGGR